MRNAYSQVLDIKGVDILVKTNERAIKSGSIFASADYLVIFQARLKGDM